MFELRSLIVWSIVFTQVWTPVLAQTLPITVDKGIAGQKPVVGIANGVPVINIAPPSAGGVSNNRYTEFNVGPSGVVLNNSGGASQTQLAGQIGGNTMLGNQRAATILNQVTAPNPSQLMGTLEVAGNRANIIVANPAGITCNGCGFLNANRATLTTGRPNVGPDGGIALDVAAGKLRVDGSGLYGADLSQVDLIARTLEINAGIWTDHLNVIAGAARVDYADATVQGRAGEGAKPILALDTSALGGMYANSIRLIGTEAGVGVNVGGNLVSLTGDLHVSAAGDVSIVPGGTVQAARHLHMQAGRDLALDGVLQGAQVTASAGRHAAVNGLVSSDGALTLGGQANLNIGPQGGLFAQQAVQLQAGQDLAVAGSLILSDRDLTAQAGRHVKFQTAPARASTAPPQQSGSGAAASGSGAGVLNNGVSNEGADTNATLANGSAAATEADQTPLGAPTAKPNPVASGVISSRDTLQLKAGRDMTLPGQANTAGLLSVQAGANISSDAQTRLQSAKDTVLRAGGGMNLAGTLRSNADTRLHAGGALTLSGDVSVARGAAMFASGHDLSLLAGSSLIAGGPIGLHSHGSLRAAGTVSSLADLTLQAARNVTIDGKLLADGRGAVEAAGNVTSSRGAQVMAGGPLRMRAGSSMNLAGQAHTNAALDLDAGAALRMTGSAVAYGGALRMASGSDVWLGEHSTTQGMGIAATAHRHLDASGVVGSQGRIALVAGGDVTLSNQGGATADVLVQAGGALRQTQAGALDAEGVFSVRAGKHIALDGALRANSGIDVAAADALSLNGSLSSANGGLALTAGAQLSIGATGQALAGGAVTAMAGGPLSIDGQIASERRVALSSQGGTAIGGKIHSGGTFDAISAAGFATRQAAQLQSVGDMRLQAARDATLAGLARSDGKLDIAARGDLRMDGDALAYGGALRLTAGNDLLLGNQSRVQGTGTTLMAGRDLAASGALVSLGDAQLESGRDNEVQGLINADGALRLQSGNALNIAAGAVLETTGSADLLAVGDMRMDGALRSNGNVRLDAGGAYRQTGQATSAGGSLALKAAGDVWLGKTAVLQAAGPLRMDGGGALNVAGTISSLADLTLQAARDAAISGQLHAKGGLTLTAKRALHVDKRADLQSNQALNITAGSDLLLAGSAQSNTSLNLTAGKQVQVDGAAYAYGGALELNAGAGLAAGGGSTLQGERIVAKAGADLIADGQWAARTGITLTADGDVTLQGRASAGEDVHVGSGGMLRSGAQAAWNAGGTLTALAANGMALAGVLRGDRGVVAKAHGAFDLQGLLASAAGAIGLDAGCDLSVGPQASVLASGNLAMNAGANARLAGVLNTLSDLAVTAAANAAIMEKAQLYAEGAMRLQAGALLAASRGSQMQSGRNMALTARDVTLSGNALSEGSLALKAARDLRVDGSVLADGGALTATSGNDLNLTTTSQVQGQGVDIVARGDVTADGAVASTDHASIQADGNATIGGSVGVDGDLAVQAAGSVSVGTSAQLSAVGHTTLRAKEQLAVAGAVRSNAGTQLEAGKDLTLQGVAAATRGALKLKAGKQVVLAAVSQVLAGGDVHVDAGAGLNAGGTVSSMANIALQSGREMNLNGTLLASGDLRAQGGQALASGYKAQIQADGDITAVADGVSLAGSWAAGRSVDIKAAKGVQVDGKVLAAQGGLRIAAQHDIRLGSRSDIQSKAPLSMQAGSSLHALGTLSGQTDIALHAGRHIALAGTTVAGGQLLASAGADLSVAKSGLAQGSNGLRLAGRDVLIAGMAGTADTAIAAGGTLDVQARRDLTVAEGGTLSAGSSATLSAQRDMIVDGTATTLGGDLSLNAKVKLNVGERGLIQASAALAALAGGDLESRGTMASGGSMALRAGNTITLGGVVAALGQNGPGDMALSAGQDLLVAVAAQVQSAGALSAKAARDLQLAGTLSSVGDMTLGVERDARISGTAAADRNLTLNANRVEVGAEGLVQAGDTLRLAATGDLLMQGRALAEKLASLAAGTGLALSGTAAALQGDLSLTADRGAVALASASHLQAGRSIDVKAGTDLNLHGAAAAGRDLALIAGQDIEVGGVAAAQQGTLSGAAGRNLHVASGAQLESAAGMTLRAVGNWINAGAILAGGDATLSAGGLLDNQGAVLAGGNLRVGANGLLSNAGRLAAGVDADGKLTRPGNMTLIAGAIAQTGVSLSGQDMTLKAGQLNLAGATLSALGKLALTAAGDIDTRLATLHGGSLALSGASLNNQQGKITSDGDAVVTLSGALSNTAGVLASAQHARIEAGQVDNQAGTLAGQNLTLTATGIIDNTEGLIQADDALLVSSSLLKNTGTAWQEGAAARGLIAKTIQITAGAVDNTRGSILGDVSVKINAGAFDNTEGRVSSRGVTDVVADTFNNSQGKLLAGERLSINTRLLQALGTLQSEANLALATNGSLNQTGDLTAGRDLSVSVGDTLDNRAKVSAGRDLTVTAGKLHNRESGELVSGGTTTINAGQHLLNAGLIDGSATRVTANHVDNLGRIYGDTIAIGAGALVNDVGASGAAVIASRGDLALGVQALINQDHALIYAGGNLNLGSALDAAGQAVGQAGSVVNASATIEAVGDARIAAALIENRNKHFESQQVQGGVTAKVYYRPDGTPDMYDDADTWLCDLVTPMCSKDPAWLLDDQERRLLLPSSTYPESRYGPPFDYALSQKGIRGKTAPIALAYRASATECTGGDAGGGCTVTEDQYFYAPDAKIWSVFGVQSPSGPPPVKPDGGPCLYPTQSCREHNAKLAAYEVAYQAYTGAYSQLNAKIRAFNADFDARMVKNFIIYRVNESVTESRTLSSDPAQITAGGNATLIGKVINDKSRIVAGGALTVSGPAIDNIGATGQRVVEASGTATRTYEKNSARRYEAAQAYTGALSSTPIELPVAFAGGHQAVSVGGKPGASALGGAQQAIGISDVARPDGSVVRSTSAPAGIPDSQLFKVNGNPDAPYLVETDPRFTGKHGTVSSDYLLELLRNPGALPETAINGSKGANGGMAGSRINASAPSSAAEVLLQGGNAGMAQAGPLVNASAGLEAEGNTAPGSATAIQIAQPSGAVAGATAGGNVGAAGTLSSTRADGWNGLVPAGARFLTPSGQPKRLGDGFYEQKLVTDQIMATTGRRYLDGYSNADAQYKALLAAGAQFAATHGVQLGVALTDAQMRQLTTDVVWLVEKEVVRADGTVDRVLVPQVYLVVREGDVKADGTLMAGRSVKLSAEGDVRNTGSIAGRDATVVSANNIVNQSGAQIRGGSVDLHARASIDNVAARIQGDAVSLKAGRDISLTSTVTDYKRGQTSGSNLSGVSHVVAGSLHMQAGRDIALTAAQVSAEGNAHLQAGRDIKLGSVTQSHQEAYNYRERNTSAVSSYSEMGSSIAASGNLTLVAGQDVKARAANVTAGQQLAVGAGRDINITAGVAGASARDELHYKTKGFLSRKTTHSIKSTDWTQAQSSTFTGDSAVLMAGRDVNVAGSNVGAQHDLVMSADRNVNIAAGVNTSANYEYEKVKKSGFGAMGGFSYGSRQRTDSLDSAKVFHTPSTVGSVTGDTLINAGGALNIMGSNVLARQGDVTLIGRDVNIGAMADTAREKEFHEFKQSGLSISASTPAVSAMQTANRMGDAAGKTDNKVMQGLALATSGLAAVNAAEAVSADPDAAGGVNINIDVGSSKSQSATKRESSSVSGSTVAAGRDLTVVAQGAGKASNVTVTGSKLSAGNNAAIKAEGDILLQAAKNTFEQHSTNKSTNASIGVGVKLGSEGVGFALNVAASAARGNADGKDSSWTSSTVTAGNVLGLQSGGNTSLIGALGEARQIITSVGNNLRIETLQDISQYTAKQQSAGFAGSLCYGYCSSTISGHVSQGKMQSDFKSATQQAGLKAGDGGFAIDVKNNTTLVGAVIASSEKAVADGLNSLTTGTLVSEDLKNSARYKASQVGISGGYGSGRGKKGGDGKDSGLGTDAQGNVAGGTKAEPGTSVPQSGGLGMGTPTVAAASGNSSSMTQSAISGGKVVIRDEAAQQDLTGMTVAESIASLNRDTASNTLNALKPIFDKEKIEAGFEIASEAQRQVGQFLASRAREAEELEKALSKEPAGSRRDQLQRESDKAKTWAPGGTSRRWLTAITAAMSGNVTGAASEIVQAAAVNYLQGLAASKVKAIATSLGDGAAAEAARAAMHAIVGCAGASLRDGSCSAGALGAGAGSIINALLSGDQKRLSPEEAEARRNLVESLVAGIALGAGADVMDATFAAANETENNALSIADHQARILEKTECKGDTRCEGEVAKKYTDISNSTRQELTQCASVEACQASIEEATALLGEYSSRIDALEEKLRSEGRLSAFEREEWTILKASAQPLLEIDRLSAIKNAIALGGDSTKQLVWDEIAKAGVAGAAAATGALSSSRNKGSEKGQGERLGELVSVPGRAQTRINLQTGNSKEGWVHVLNRHFDPRVNASQFTISKDELRGLLQSKAVVNTPITREISSRNGTRYIREVYFEQKIGIDKFTRQPTKTMTVVTDSAGNLITATPGVLK